MKYIQLEMKLKVHKYLLYLVHIIHFHIFILVGMVLNHNYTFQNELQQTQLYKLGTQK